MFKNFCVVVAFVISGCAMESAIVKDVKACVSEDAPAAVQTLEKNAAPAIEQAFMCDAEAGFNPNALPVCLEVGLARETAGIGPDADRFKLCVTNKIENDPAAAKLAKQRASIVGTRIRAKMAAEAK